MKVNGIEFTHRRPENNEWAAKDYAQFSAFAALCELSGVARFINWVFFDTKWQGFNIDVDMKYEHTPIHEAIRTCGEKTLSQFDLFGMCHHKEDSTDERNQS